jgi:hypothetical protein
MLLWRVEGCNDLDDYRFKDVESATTEQVLGVRLKPSEEYPAKSRPGLTGETLESRRALLEKVLPKLTEPIRYSPELTGGFTSSAPQSSSEPASAVLERPVHWA